MGQATEDVLCGLTCEGCGEWNHNVIAGADEPGHPWNCAACARYASQGNDGPDGMAAGWADSQPLPVPDRHKPRTPEQLKARRQKNSRRKARIRDNRAAHAARAAAALLQGT